jgi:hypothetical protein
LGDTNTIRTIDRSEGLWEANFVTGTYDGTITGTDGKPYTTRAAWVNYLNNEAVGEYSTAIHGSHVSYACSVCHSDSLGGTNADYSLVSDPTLDEDQQFTVTSNPVGGNPTCVAQCHLTASAPVPSNIVKARLSATIDMETNFKVNLDGSKSTCYNVDVATGQVTQGTNKTYSWTFTGGTQPATDPTDCTGSATCAATWTAGETSNVTLEVGCESPVGTEITDDATVSVTSIDVGKGVQATPQLAYTVDAETKILTLKAPNLDAEVINGKVQILWGDTTRTDLTDAVAIATFKTDGVAHTYPAAGAYTITVGTTNDGTPNNKVYTYTLNVTVPTP